MSGRAKAVDAERTTITGQAIAAPADQPGAKPGRDLRIVGPLPQRKAIARIGDGVGRESAVARVTREYRRVAEILSIAAAIRTGPARRAQPGNSDALANGKSTHARPQCRHAADNLMARDNR